MNLVQKIKETKLLLFSLIIFPHILIFMFTKRGYCFQKDLEVSFHSGSFACFIRVMHDKKYIRNLFYYRTGYLFRELFSFLCPEDSSLHLMGCPYIGKSCHLEHSQNTFLNAQHIGDNFYCLHNVTIGNDLRKGRPWIGNNVRIYTGAVIVGDIVIGDNSIIAANSVVRKNVPANTLVAGVPAKIIKVIS